MAQLWPTTESRPYPLRFGASDELGSMATMGAGQVSPQITCSYCGETIGVYEPVVVIAAGRVAHTSRAVGGVSPESLAVHEDCYSTRSEALKAVGLAE